MYFVFFTFLTNIISAQNRVADSLETLLKKSSGTEKIFLLNELSWEYCFYDLKKAKQYSLRALEEAHITGDQKSIADSYNGLGIIYLKTGEFEKGLEANFEALKRRKMLNDKKGIGSSKSKIGSIYIEQSKYEEALKYHQEALAVFEELEDKQAIGQTLNNICHIHKSMGNYEKMKEYALRATEIFTEIDFTYGLGSSYGNIGVYYQKTNKPDSSVFWNLKARELLLKVNALQDVSICDNNLGVAYRLMGDNEKGLSYYLEAYELSKQTDDPAGMAQYGTNIGSVYNDLGAYEKAKIYLLEALPFTEQHQLDKLRSQIYDVLSDSYKGLGDIEKAFYYRKRYEGLKDSIFNDDRLAKFSEMEVKYETEKKEKENRELTIKNQEAQLKIKEAEKDALLKRNWMVGGGMLCVIVILLIVFYYYRKRKTEQQLYQQKIIEEREEGLKAVFIATEEERKRIAKDLHDGVGQQLSGLKMAWQKFSSETKDEKQNEKINQLARILDDAAADVRTISHQMMPKVLGEVGLAAAIEDMLGKSLGNTAIRYQFEEYGLENRLAENIELSVYRICQEMVNNIIKHSGATQVNVQLFVNKGFLILVVEDNGTGMDAEEESDGIGLKNISSRISTISGEINWEPGPESGTVATIRVPLQ